MNFFTVGFALTAIIMNADLAAGYALRFIGALFLIGGANETECVTKGFLRYKKPSAAVAVLCAAASAAVLLTDGSVKKYAAIGFSLVITAAALLLQRSILLKMKKRHKLVGNPDLIKTLKKTWDKMAFFCALTSVCELLDRVLPDGGFRLYIIEIALVCARIICYIYVILMTRAFNRVRDDFNSAHPIDHA